ncbi:unnamed protein product [Adineta ricciae]|uniref:Uncharacterized protein n=1 Tax=Adineta ricciae TaxID=249248 RepID=A0A814LEB1_ADIRI|nr:unnamed protein product [Adineta ricciae]
MPSIVIFYCLFLGNYDDIRRWNGAPIYSNLLPETYSSEKTKTRSEEIEYNSKNLPSSPASEKNDEHRTVHAHHLFYADIKHTFIRFLRETPV